MSSLSVSTKIIKISDVKGLNLVTGIEISCKIIYFIYNLIIIFGKVAINGSVYLSGPNSKIFFHKSVGQCLI